MSHQRNFRVGKEQNQMDEFSNSDPPTYEEVTKKKIRIMKYGSMEQNGSLNSSRQVSEEQDVYTKENKTIYNENTKDTNPFR